MLVLVCEVSIKLNQGYLLLAGCFGWVRNSQLADSPIGSLCSNDSFAAPPFNQTAAPDE